MTGYPRTHYFEDLELGQEARTCTIVAAADIVRFAEVSGDMNPVHLDPAYAQGTIFGGCVAHGMLTASYISAVFGMQLPGPGAIYVSQTLNFRGPVRVGDEVVTVVRVADLYAEKRRARFDCECLVGDKPVLIGEAVLLVPRRPTAEVEP